MISQRAKNFILHHFLGLICFGIFSFYLFFYWVGRIPSHDTLAPLLWAFHFFNSFNIYGELGLWAPQMDWGKPLHLFFLVINYPSLILLYPLTLFIKDMLFIYYLSLALNEFIFILGVYLLAREYLENKKALMFVTVSAWLSLEIFYQMQWGLIFIMPIPFIFYLVTQAINKLDITYLLCSLVFLSIHAAYGSLLYMGIFQAITSLVFFLALAYSRKFNIIKFIKSFSLLDFFILFFIVIVLICPLLFLKVGELPSFISPGRDSNGKVSYHVFLGYALDYHFTAFSNFFTGTGYNKDIRVYIGKGAPFFILLGLIFSKSAFLKEMLIVFGALFLFSLGPNSFLAPLSFYIPGVAWFRHISFVINLAKIPLLILLGIGLDLIFKKIKKPNDKRNDPLFFILINTLNFIFCVLSPLFFMKLKGFYGVSSIFVAIVICFTSYAYCFNSKLIKVVPYLLLVLVLDGVAGRVGDYYRYSYPLSQSDLELFKFRKLEYQDKRKFSYLESPAFSQYMSIIASSPDLKNLQQLRDCLLSSRCFTPRFSEGSYYNIIEQFTGFEPCRPLFKTDNATGGVIKLYKKFNIIDEVDPDFNTGSFRFNERYLKQDKLLQNEEFKRITGCETSKIVVPKGISYQVVEYSPQKIGIKFDKAIDESLDLIYLDSWSKKWKLKIGDREIPTALAHEAFKLAKVEKGTTYLQWTYDTSWENNIVKIVWLQIFIIYSYFLVFIRRELFKAVD